MMTCTSVFLSLHSKSMFTEMCWAGMGLASGLHEAALVVRSNDPSRPIARLPIALLVP